MGLFRIVRYIMGVRFSGASVKRGSTVYWVFSHSYCQLINSLDSQDLCDIEDELETKLGVFKVHINGESIMFMYVAVSGRNQRSFCCIFRLHCRVRSTIFIKGGAHV